MFLPFVQMLPGASSGHAGTWGGEKSESVNWSVIFSPVLHKLLRLMSPAPPKFILVRCSLVTGHVAWANGSPSPYLLDPLDFKGYGGFHLRDF